MIGETRRMARGDEKPGGQSQTGWISTHAGRHLRGRRKAHTRPEIELRRAVHALGLRFRLQRRLASGCTPDFVLPRHKIAVFVDGCFWHGCDRHGRKTFGGPNAELWKDKLRRNRDRDRRADDLAQEAGWRVVRLWECDVLADPCGTAVLVASTADAHRR